MPWMWTITLLLLLTRILTIARHNKLSPAGHSEHGESSECRAVVSTAIRIRNKISLEWQVSSGPDREAGAASAAPGRCDAVESGDSPRDMDCTSDTQHEIRLLQRLGPHLRRLTGAHRRRCRGTGGVDARVAAAEKNAQQRHDPPVGTECGGDPFGSGRGSQHCHFVMNPPVAERAAQDVSCSASQLALLFRTFCERLPQNALARAEPGPKSGPLLTADSDTASFVLGPGGSGSSYPSGNTAQHCEASRQATFTVFLVTVT